MDAEQRAAAREDLGDLAAQVHRLQANLRQGRVTSPQLELAAWTGHAAARALLGSRESAWSGVAPLLDRASALTLAAAAGRVALERAGAALGDSGRAGLRSLENWLAGRIGLPQLIEVGLTYTDTEFSNYQLLTVPQAIGLRAQFRREVLPGAATRDIWPVASAWGSDDIMGIVTEGAGAPFAVGEAHLTYTNHPGTSIGATLFSDLKPWLVPDGWLRYDDADPAQSLCASVVPFALCPATLDRYPWFNAWAAMACLEVWVGAEDARARVGSLVQTWALSTDP